MKVAFAGPCGRERFGLQASQPIVCLLSSLGQTWCQTNSDFSEVAQLHGVRPSKMKPCLLLLSPVGVAMELAHFSANRDRLL